MIDPVHRLERSTEPNNFTYLAVALVVFQLGLAVIHELGITLGQDAVAGALLAALAIGVWSMRGERRWHRTRLGLLVAMTFLFILRLWQVQAGLDIFWSLFLFAYLVFTTWAAMTLVLFSGSVDWNKIVGSFCIYMLLGIMWADLYALLAQFRPGSFSGLATYSWHGAFPQTLYFSFATLTTVGYGDITPAASFARFLAYMEAMMGQFYLAVLVATLVGSILSNQGEPGRT